jgi:hypothetical protein
MKRDGSAGVRNTLGMVTLAGAGDGGTLLTPRPENLPSSELREGHDVAWITYLPRLAARADSGDPGPDPHG